MQYKEINPENFRAVARKVKEHVRILAIRHDVVLYYRENGKLIAEKPGKWKKEAGLE